MTIALLTLILLSYMKVTGKSLPAVERCLNKVRNSKKKGGTDLTSVTEKELANLDINKLNSVPFKSYKTSTLYPKTFSGSLKI